MFFSKLSGFDISNLAKLPALDRRKIELYSLWGIISCILCTLSAVYLFKITTQSFLVAIVAGIIVFVCFIAIQGLLISNRGEHFGTQKSDDIASKPNRFNIFIYLLLTILFTQPILIYISHHLDQEKVATLNKLEYQLRIQNIDDLHQAEYANAKFDLARIREKINSLGGNLSLYVPQDDTQIANNQSPNSTLDISQSARKALVFGNQKYLAPQTTLYNPKNDAKGISAKLIKMGFQVTQVLDASRFDMESNIDTFVNSLQPGDVSFVYYSGHGLQLNQYNYFVPTDTRDDFEALVKLNNIMQKISDKKVLASVYVIDACRSNPSNKNESGFATQGVGPNTFIALAASAGEESIDGPPGTNGVFTKPVIKYINEEKDIDSIFKKVKDELAKDRSVKQNPTSINFLDEPLILAVQNATQQTNDVSKMKPDQKTSAYRCQNTKISNDPSFDRQELLFNCISEYVKISDDLKQDLTASDYKRKNKIEEKFSDDHFNPLYFYSYLWSNQTLDDSNSSLKPSQRSALLSLLIWFVLAGGFIYRENMGGPLLNYRRFRNEEDSINLRSLLQQYQLKSQENYKKFKSRIQSTITSTSLLNESIETQLPNPFSENDDVLERRNKYIRTGREAVDNLNKALAKP
jgi:hypothetical protein